MAKCATAMQYRKTKERWGVAHRRTIPVGSLVCLAFVLELPSKALPVRFSRIKLGDALPAAPWSHVSRRCQPQNLFRRCPAWYALVGKELRLLQSGAGVRRKGENKNAGNERNEVSGLVWCRDGKGSENVRHAVVNSLVFSGGLEIGQLRVGGPTVSIVGTNVER